MMPNFGLVKLSAFALMLADHCIALCCPALAPVRVVTHQAFVLFACSVAFAWSDLTRDRSAYLRRLLLFAVVSQLPFALAFPGRLNVLFVFVLGLFAAGRRGCRLLSAVAAALLCASLVPCDGGPLGVLGVVFAARGSWTVAAGCFALVMMPAGLPCSALAVASVALFRLSGLVDWRPAHWSRSRLWYWFYPAHLFVLMMYRDLFV